ncbi:hypothetical protein B0H17DRAFT_1196940 [Mycena rosella]|uniref:Uncharacterized protein n=1 Tax=Mycena rosella TaxID=1033263 RepID=A0AAD7DUW1_MYCRO|nr:hypothetical protein B0H17DRAFT_1196940 [Mycena rosella]
MPSESSSAPVPANVESPPQQQSPESVSPLQEPPQVSQSAQLLSIDLTLHRLFTGFTVVGFLIPKDVTSGIGLSMVSLHLDWVGGTIALL